jgi:hypothetical protein
MIPSTTISTPPPAAKLIATTVSNGVSVLKCDGTCRQA